MRPKVLRAMIPDVDKALELRGTRVTLRGLTEHDLEFVRQLRNLPENRRQFFFQGEIGAEAQKAWYAKYAADPTDLNVIVFREGTRIGTMALYRLDAVNRSAEYGRVLLAAEAHGYGFAGEAALLLLRYGFKKLGLHRIFLEVFSDNDAAIRVYRQLGFHEEGVRRDAFMQDGSWRRVVCMSMLEKESPE
jgi:RimJ/RimL family protein N-acetyltransferase